MLDKFSIDDRNNLMYNEVIWSTTLFGFYGNRPTEPLNTWLTAKRVHHNILYYDIPHPLVIKSKITLLQINKHKQNILDFQAFALYPFFCLFNSIQFCRVYLFTDMNMSGYMHTSTVCYITCMLLDAIL